MAFQTNGTSSTVTISGNISLKNNPLTTLSSTGVATLGTVPANKVWKIINIFLSCIGSSHQAEIKLNDVANQFYIISNLAIGDGLAVNIPFNPSACPVLTAGQTIKSNCSGGIASVSYYEETT